MRKRKCKLMKNQNPDHAPEMNPNQGKIKIFSKIKLEKIMTLLSGKKLVKKHVTTMKIAGKENVKDQLSLIPKLQKNPKRKRTIN